MSDQILFTSLSPHEVKKLMKEAIIEHEVEKSKQISLTKTYSFNQVKDMLGCSHSTVKKLVNEGVLETTADQRKIPQWAVENYLKTKK